MLARLYENFKHEDDSAFDWQAYYRKQADTLPDGPLKRFYQAGVPAMDTTLSNTDLIALDLETTGLRSQKDVIVSVGSVAMNCRRIQCASAKYWLVNPGSPLSAESITIHELTHSDVAEAPPLNRYFEAILESLAGKVVVVHCAAIERQFLYQAAKKLYGHDLFFPILDTLALEQKILKQRPLIKRLFKSKTSVRLDACRQRYGLPRYKAHHALTDAFSSAELLQAQIAHHFDYEKSIGEYWS